MADGHADLPASASASASPSAVTPAPAPAWHGRPLGRRQFLIGGGALAASAAGAALVPRHASPALARNTLAAAIPQRFGEWRTVPAADFVLPLEDEGVKGVYSDILTRAYTSVSGAVIMLVIAYAGGQTGTIVVHRPEACYPANGFQLTNRAEAMIVDPRSRVNVPAICYSAQSYYRTEQLLYWTRIGKFFPTDWLTEQVALVRSNFAGRLPDGVLVRMSVISDDVAASRTLLRDFAKSLSEAVSAVGRDVLFDGTDAARSPG